MSIAISCGYAKVAIQDFFQRHKTAGVKLPTAKSQGSQILDDYNENFKNYPNLQVPQSILKRVPKLLKSFNKKWHPAEKRKSYLQVFSLRSWAEAPENEKKCHTLRNCHVCGTKYQAVFSAFPGALAPTESTTITFTSEELSSPKKLGRKVLEELSPLCQANLGESPQEVLEKTPRSRLVRTPTAADKHTKKRKIIREAKQVLQNEMDKNAATTVMGNRISWSAFDKIRKQALSNEPNSKNQSKKHGCKPEALEIDKENLLLEAQSWSPTKEINWSDVARRYELEKKNGGQCIKEFLKEHDIPAALIDQTPNRNKQRKRKTLPGGIPFPMERPISAQKEVLAEKIDKGEILLGEEVVPSTHNSYTVDTSNSIVEKTATIHARKISLCDIQMKLLSKHEKMNLLRKNSDQYFDSLTNEEVITRLSQLHECPPSDTDKRELLKKISRQRFLKVWHDHSTIAGHGHLLVLVTCMYDPAFYYTQKELESHGITLDVESVVEEPEIHILGRSKSSLRDQCMFTECRLHCLLEMSPIPTSEGVLVSDILRFFHGDGPAQQFEVGQHVGGDYFCIGCTVESSRSDDLVHSFRCHQLSYLERREFVLKGQAWKKGGVNPLDNLKVNQLREEISARGDTPMGLKKPQLEKTFNSMRKGIANLPALSQPYPTRDLKELKLQHYELLPSEPMHDLKGHFANLIEESAKIAEGDAEIEIKKIKNTVLGKDTLRASDYRKAIVLICTRLQTTSCSVELKQVFYTAMELCQLCYAREHRRTPRAILRLHNISFLHAYLCKKLFECPKTITRRKMFGRYFHSIVTHIPIIYRIASLRSVNAEKQERIFGQAKQTTKATSSNRPQHVVLNIIQRLQIEQNKSPMVSKEESIIGKLYQTAGMPSNTVIPTHIMTTAATQYQAHLERISDFLAEGGVWWKRDPKGVEFFDGAESNTTVPGVMHFRSNTLESVALYLQMKWEQCISLETPTSSRNTHLPFKW